MICDKFEIVAQVIKHS